MSGARTTLTPAAPAKTGVPGFWPALTLIVLAIVGVARARVDHPLSLSGMQTPLAPWPDMRMDLNVASAGELTALPGVGPRLAERIVESRATAGPFRSLGDVTRVHRVGPVLRDRIRAHAVVGGRADLPDAAPRDH